MSELQRWILRAIIRRIVRQGVRHRANVVEYYRLMNEGPTREFSEDDEMTLAYFARERFDEARP